MCVNFQKLVLTSNKTYHVWVQKTKPTNDGQENNVYLFSESQNKQKM
jgi:hypothetical protein